MAEVEEDQAVVQVDNQLLFMLLIHWTKQNNTGDILKNGIRPTKRKTQTEEGELEIIKGVWCYPYTRNKNFNNNWKSNLKVWRKELTNFNGFVFKLEQTDFPIYAGDFSFIRLFPKELLFDSYENFKDSFGKFFSPESMSFEINEENLEEGWLDYGDFEIIIPNRIEPNRIIKVIKDRGKGIDKKPH